MAKEHTNQQKSRQVGFPEFPLSFFACPNPECADFNRFDAGNLSIAERMGKDKAIRRLYCKTCGSRFSEREGSLMEDTKLPEEVVVRIIKCLVHGCSIEATADICEVDQRTVERYLQKGGRRADGFHRLQLERLQEAKGRSAERLADKITSVQLDELHGRVAKPAGGGLTPESKKGGKSLLGRIVERVGRGFIPPWR